MKVVILVLLVLVFGVFVGAELGDEWDSFDGGDSSGSSIEVSVNVEDSGVVYPGVGDSVDYSSGRYKLEFYIALGVGALGILIVVVFLYFFFRKPKNKWKNSR